MEESFQRSILVFDQRQTSTASYNAPGLIGCAGRVFMGSVLNDSTAGQQRTITGILIVNVEDAVWRRIT